MRDVAEIVIPWVIVTLGLFALIDWDESRLSADAREETWPPATRTLAIVYFGLLAMPIHFWRTRIRARIDRALLAAARAGIRLPRGWTKRAIFCLGLMPPTLLVAVVVDWTLGLVVDALPEPWTGWAMALSLAGFALSMVWRWRKGGWYQSARGH